MLHYYAIDKTLDVFDEPATKLQPSIQFVRYDNVDITNKFFIDGLINNTRFEGGQIKNVRFNNTHILRTKIFCNITSSVFVGVRFEYVKTEYVEDCRFFTCDFLNSDLYNALFVGCNFVRCVFNYSILRRCAFHNCVFDRCRILDTDMTHIKLIHNTYQEVLILGSDCTNARVCGDSSGIEFGGTRQSGMRFETIA